ncbi:hypothetical protein [Tenacibaculum ovolyticum]|uniref:hypothetical protein n=1 Tax=Tenacibaculum ovolyticum TaxID=104270 RepID=UPI0007ED8DFF|nr:hypothetical protein [Tenacibaculum ovolyticum]
MKRIILNIIVILSLFYCNTSFSQTLEKPLRIKSQRSNSRRPQRLKQDEFVNRRSPLKDIFTVAPCYVNCDVAGSKGDLRFTTSSPSSFNVILSNHNSIVRAARKSYRAWHRKQLNVIKNKLDAKFGKKFSNYNEAKNMLFADSERRNIIKSVSIAKPKYSNLKSSGFRKQKEHKKKLKLLRLRENEIKAGNINNSKYGFIKVGNVYLKDLKSTKALNKHWYPLVSEFNKNTATTHINNYIYKAFSKTGVNSIVVSAKNNYYNRLNDWDKLDFIQFLINYEYYKKYNSPPYAYSAKMSRLFKKFNKLEVATPSLVENYAIKNRDGGISVFDDNYWNVLFKKSAGFEYGSKYSWLRINDMNRHYYSLLIFKLKKKHKKLRKEALDKLIATESTAEFAIANLIGELGVSNQSQKNWLYKYKTKANELIKFANDNRVGGKIPVNVKSAILKSVTLSNNLNQFNKKINSSSFDPLSIPWLKMLREYAQFLENLKNVLSEKIVRDHVRYLDQQLTIALTKTAFRLNPKADTTKESNKEYEFKNNGKAGVGVLLYEFANGTGKDVRNFSFDYDMTAQMLAGNAPNDIKIDFYKTLSKEGISSYDEFILKGKEVNGRYAFSPDHTGVVDSFNKHKNANWVHFVAGTSTVYYPSNDPGWIIVEMRNPTSRNSLLLHQGENYNRNGLGTSNLPLSTIWQIFKFKLKVK